VTTENSNLTNEKSFMLICDLKMQFSVFEDKLLFLHSLFMSGQYLINPLAIDVIKHPHNTKVSFFMVDDKHCKSYQAYYFKREEFEPLVSYFKSLGFPVPESSFCPFPDP